MTGIVLTMRNYVLLKLTTQKMVALIHEGLDDGGQFRPNLGLVININCIVFIMSLLIVQRMNTIKL